MMQTVKINVHEDGCRCGCAGRRYRLVVDMPGSGMRPVQFTRVERMLDRVRELVVNGPPDQPSVRRSRAARRRTARRLST